MYAYTYTRMYAYTYRYTHTHTQTGEPVALCPVPCSMFCLLACLFCFRQKCQDLFLHHMFTKAPTSSRQHRLVPEPTVPGPVVTK